MSKVRHLEVGPDEADRRLDRWFKEHFPTLGHGRLEKLLRTGQIRVDGGRAKAGLRLTAGAKIRIPPLPAESEEKKRPRKAPSREDTERLRASILYQDEMMIVINKPPGLAVQGGSKVTRNLDAMLEGLRMGAAEAPRLVHRLDKDTSGVLVLARDRAAARALSAAFKTREVRKIYWALVVGVPQLRSGEVESKLEKLPGRSGERVTISDTGARAITRYDVIDRGGDRIAWLALMPLTGRTHQLRVHCAALGTPILGDGKYGEAGAFVSGLSEQMHLHARSITLPNPKRGSKQKSIQVSAPLPPHMQESWDFFNFDSKLDSDPFEDG